MQPIYNLLLNNAGTVDVRSQQETLNKRFATLTLSKADEMEIDVFHLLKASNAPLILFDRVINWLQRYESVVRKNGTDHLMKREMFLHDLNAKLYGKEVLMKPSVEIFSSHQVGTLILLLSLLKKWFYEWY